MRNVVTLSAILKHKGASVWAIGPEATVFQAIELMAEKNVGALMVMEADKPVGIISERDYTRKVALKGRSSKDTKVREILSGSLISATPHHTVEDSMRLMTEHKVRHLPVLEEGKLIGIVSIGDLVNWIISVQDVTINHLESYISGKYPG